MLLEEKGPALRGAFIIDPDGVLRSACVHDEGSARNTGKMPRVLQAPQTGEQCPVDWPSGEATLG